MQVLKTQSKVTVFKRIILNGETYQANDSISIWQKNDVTGFGKINKIWQQERNNKSFVNICWFYTPSEVFEVIPEFISSAELFESDNVQDVEVQCILGKIIVHTFDEYHSKDEVDENVYFCRAKFDYSNKTLNPCLSTWTRVCYCNSIVNPDLVYNRCDGCFKCFHFECCEFVGDSNEYWLCKICSNN